MTVSQRTTRLTAYYRDLLSAHLWLSVLMQGRRRHDSLQQMLSYAAVHAWIASQAPDLISLAWPAASRLWPNPGVSESTWRSHYWSPDRCLCQRLLEEPKKIPRSDVHPSYIRNEHAGMDEATSAALLRKISARACASRGGFRESTARGSTALPVTR